MYGYMMCLYIILYMYICMTLYMYVYSYNSTYRDDAKSLQAFNKWTGQPGKPGLGQGIILPFPQWGEYITTNGMVQ